MRCRTDSCHSHSMTFEARRGEERVAFASEPNEARAGAVLTSMQALWASEKSTGRINAASSHHVYLSSAVQRSAVTNHIIYVLYPLPLLASLGKDDHLLDGGPTGGRVLGLLTVSSGQLADRQSQADRQRNR